MIRYFVGVPGSGKSTIACKLLYKHSRGFKLFKRKYDYLFANFDTVLANKFNTNDLATKKPPKKSLIMLDESGLEFNSRQFKSLSLGIIEYFKMHRHEKQDIYLFSQTWDDTDKQIRDLAQEIWLIRKIGPLSVARCVQKKVGIDDISKQLQYQHFFKSILWQLIPFMPKQFVFCWRPKYYKFFNSYEELYRPLIEPDNDLQFKSVNAQMLASIKR